MIADAARLLALIYVPLMLSLALVLLLLGIVGIVAPGSLRRIMNVFTRNGPVRVLGVLLIIVGAEMFIQARNTTLPLLVKGLGALMFVDGGVRLFVPTLSVILMEKTRGVRPLGLRLIGLLEVGAAWLFYLAAQLPPPPVA
jgi:hypothetical protein